MFQKTPLYSPALNVLNSLQVHFSLPPSHPFSETVLVWGSSDSPLSVPAVPFLFLSTFLKQQSFSLPHSEESSNDF